MAKELTAYEFSCLVLLVLIVSRSPDCFSRSFLFYDVRMEERSWLRETRYSMGCNCKTVLSVSAET